MHSLSPEARATERKLRPRGRYHTAPTNIRPSDDIRVSHCSIFDQYIGTADSLAAAGLLRRELFPGEPGQPVSAVTYRPIDAVRGQDEYLCHLPGYMQVFRQPSGLFRILLNVSREEQARRKQEADRKEQERHARLEAARQAAAREEVAGLLANRALANERAQSVIAEYNAALERSPAVLRVGDKAVYYGGEELTQVTVLVGYGVHNVRDDGLRFGYCVKGTAGEFAGDTFFSPAGLLVAMDSKPSHLRLVAA